MRRTSLMLWMSLMTEKRYDGALSMSKLLRLVSPLTSSKLYTANRNGRVSARLTCATRDTPQTHGGGRDAGGGVAQALTACGEVGRSEGDAQVREARGVRAVGSCVGRSRRARRRGTSGEERRRRRQALLTARAQGTFTAQRGTHGRRGSRAGPSTRSSRPPAHGAAVSPLHRTAHDPRRALGKRGTP